MFKCDSCGKITKPKEPMTKIVKEIRPRTYEDQYGNQIAIGNEIVKEESHCLSCITSK